MNEIEVNARISMLERQRNDALNQLVLMAGQMMVMQTEKTELEERIKILNAKQSAP